MDATSVAEILPDARLLAQYAYRAARLPRHSRLFEQIDRVTLALSRGEAPGAQALLDEMALVSEATGVTVAQLRRSETRLGRVSHRAAVVTPYLIGLLTLLLTLYLSFQSSELHQADLALREHQELVGERLPEKIYFAWKMYRYERVLNVQAPTLAQLDGYQKLVADAKRLNAKLAAVRGMLADSSNMRLVPVMFQTYGPCWSRRIANALNAPTAAPLDCERQRPAAGAPGSLPQAPPLDLACARAPEPEPPVRGRPLAAAETKIDLEAFESSIGCFVRQLNISDYNAPLDESIYLVRNKLFLLVSWLLPCLYGLLGACVFLMRRLLFVNSSVGGLADARIVDLLSLILRIALGGLAGIIIGWFWAPTALTTNSSALSVSSLPFGIAFLAGFSIDSLFKLLDRLNRTIGVDDRKDDDPTAGGTGGAGERAADRSPVDAVARSAAVPPPGPVGPASPPVPTPP